MQPTPQRDPGRPRDQKTRLRILAAGLRLVGVLGYQHTTIQTIAKAAGVSRQTIYRWWRTKSELLLEAVLSEISSQNLTDTSIEGFLRDTFAFGRSAIGQVVVGLMADAQHDQQLHNQFKDRLTGMRRTLLIHLLEAQATANGAEFIVSSKVIADMLFGAMWYRLLDQHAPLSDTFASELARAAQRLMQTEHPSTLLVIQ